MQTNTFLISRKLFQHHFWLNKNFDKGKAWIDLVGLANWKDSDFAKRGDLRTTMGWLAERWGWKRLKVFRYLNELKMLHQINIKSTTKYTVITIYKYNEYQLGEQQTNNKRTTNDTTNGHYINTEKKEIQKVSKTPYNPPLEELEEIATRYGVPLAFVKFQLETLQNYIASSGKVYKDPKAALRNFVLRDMKKTLERKQTNGISYTKIS